MGFWIRSGGILLGAISLFSLSAKLFNFGLAPVIEDFLKFYRDLLYPLADALLTSIKWAVHLVHIELPKIPSDALIIYCVIASSLARFIWQEKTTAERALLVLAPTIWPLTFLVFLIVYLDNFGRIVSFEGVDVVDIFPGWATEIGKIFVAFLFLFGTNAYFSP
jgi:hypothetical protein